jgi:predicted Rdx family selenoprotein
LAQNTLVVPQGTTHTVTGKEVYDSFEVAGTLIVEEGGELTVGLGAEKSVIDGFEAKVIVNGGVIKLNSRIDVGNDSIATIIMNGGLFRIGNVDSIDDAGDIKMPDDDGGHQRIILNGGLLWAHRCQMKHAATDDAKIIVGGGEMRLDAIGIGEDPGEPESYDPNDWLAAGRLELAEDGGYTELVVSPSTATKNYYSISAIAAKPTETLVVPQGTTHTVTGKEAYMSFEVAGTLIVEKGGELTAGLGTNKPRSTIDGPEAKLIVNGGTINLNARINSGIAGNATIIMNDGLFRIGRADSNDEVGDLKLPDTIGGTQRIILNGGLLWAHRCQIKIAETDDAQIIVGGGELRLDMLGDDEPAESYVPSGWQAAGKLLLAENYAELVVSPNSPTQNYIKISAIAAPPTEALVVPQGTTYTVTGRESYTGFEVAGTLIVEKGGVLTTGLGTDRPRSTIDGPEAKVIVNGGTINVNSRVSVGISSNATIIMNGGLFRIGNADSIDDVGDIKLPDEGGGIQRIILNDGLLWAHRCDVKFGLSDDAKIIVAGGEMRIDEMGEDDLEQSFDPNDWLTAGILELAENKGYTSLVFSPSTATQSYIKISAK